MDPIIKTRLLLRLPSYLVIFGQNNQQNTYIYVSSNKKVNPIIYFNFFFHMTVLTDYLYILIHHEKVDPITFHKPVSFDNRIFGSSMKK